MPPTPLPTPELPPPLGVLDEAKRRMIIALLANGSSRRAAARYVGCAASTITRTAARDPEFARQLALAEQTTEVDQLVETCREEEAHLRWPLVQHPTSDLCEVPSPEIATSQESQQASDVQQ